MDKEDVVYTHTHIDTHKGLLLSHKKNNEILSFETTWMSMSRITLSRETYKIIKSLNHNAKLRFSKLPRFFLPITYLQRKRL